MADAAAVAVSTPEFSTYPPSTRLCDLLQISFGPSLSAWYPAGAMAVKRALRPTAVLNGMSYLKFTSVVYLDDATVPKNAVNGASPSLIGANACPSPQQ